MANLVIFNRNLKNGSSMVTIQERDVRGRIVTNKNIYVGVGGKMSKTEQARIVQDIKSIRRDKSIKQAEGIAKKLLSQGHDKRVIDGFNQLLDNIIDAFPDSDKYKAIAMYLLR